MREPLTPVYPGMCHEKTPVSMGGITAYSTVIRVGPKTVYHQDNPKWPDPACVWTGAQADKFLRSDGYRNYDEESMREGKAQCKAALQRVCAALHNLII